MLVVTFFWALGHPLGRIILREISPLQLGSINLVVGVLCLAVYLAFTGQLRSVFKLPAVDLVVSLSLGVFGFFMYQIFTFNALARIPASINAILISTNVILIAIFAEIFLRERVGRMRILGIFLAMIGVVFVIFNRGFNLEGNISVIGVVFSFSAAMVFALYSVFAKSILRRNEPIIVVFLALLSGAILLLLTTIISTGFTGVVESGFKILALSVILGIGMIGLAYPVYFSCLKRLPATHISIFIYTTPVFAVILSYLILNERFSWLFWFGSALVLSGIVTAGLISSAKIRN